MRAFEVPPADVRGLRRHRRRLGRRDRLRGAGPAAHPPQAAAEAHVAGETQVAAEAHASPRRHPRPPGTSRRSSRCRCSTPPDRLAPGASAGDGHAVDVGSVGVRDCPARSCSTRRAGPTGSSSAHGGPVSGGREVHGLRAAVVHPDHRLASFAADVEHRDSVRSRGRHLTARRMCCPIRCRPSRPPRRRRRPGSNVAGCCRRTWIGTPPSREMFTGGGGAAPGGGGGTAPAGSGRPRLPAGRGLALRGAGAACGRGSRLADGRRGAPAAAYRARVPAPDRARGCGWTYCGPAPPGTPRLSTIGAPAATAPVTAATTITLVR